MIRKLAHSTRTSHMQSKGYVLSCTTGVTKPARDDLTVANIYRDESLRLQVGQLTTPPLSETMGHYTAVHRRGVMADVDRPTIWSVLGHGTTQRVTN